MLSLFEFESITQKELLGRVEKIKAEKQEIERWQTVLLAIKGQTIDVVLAETQITEFCQKVRESLVQTKANMDKMIDIESNLKSLCARIVPDLDNCTNQDKKDAYTFLDLKVTATPESVNIKGYIDPESIKDKSCLLINKQSSG